MYSTENRSQEIEGDTIEPARKKTYTIWVVCGLTFLSALAALLIADRKVDGGVFSSRGSSLSTSPPRCFENRTELVDAVDSFLRKDGIDRLYKTYGQPIGQWCVDRVSDMSELFSAKRNELAIEFDEDLGGWNVSQAVNLSSMFYGAIAFRGESVNRWRPSNAVDISWMFAKAVAFNGDVYFWDTRKVQSIEGMFQEASSFNRPLFPDVSSVTTMSRTFEGAWRFNHSSTLELWNTARVSDMSHLFREAWAFDADISAWNTSSVTDMSHLFRDARSFTSSLSSWKVSNVQDMHWMFSGAEAFNTDISFWDTARVTDMNYMFFRAFQFSGDLSRWDVSRTTNMAGMFRDSNFNGSINAWNVSGVWNMLEMFRNNPVFNGHLGDWDVGDATTMRFMFADADAFDGNLGSWTPTSAYDMTGMFEGADSFTGTNLSAWRVSPFANQMSFMFRNAKSFRWNLCSWSDNLLLHVTPNLTLAFEGTACPQQGPVQWSSNSVGPLCVSCV